MSDKRIKVAVIGYGHIGKRHAKVIRDSDIFELTAIVDNGQRPDVDNLDSPVQLFSSLEAFLNADTAVQLVVIATPNGLHSHQIDLCLDRGLDIIVEKPMVLSHRALETHLSKAREKGVQLFPVVQNRYAKISQWLKQVLHEGLLGKIYIIQVNCLWNRDGRYYQKESWHGDLNLDGGSLYTQFLHFIDMICWLFGQPSVKKAQLLDFNHQALSHFEDSGMIEFGFEAPAVKDSLTTMTFSTAAWGQNAESAMTILAEKGSVKIGGQYMEQLLYAIGSDLPDGESLQKQLSTDPYKQKYGAAAGHYRFWEELAKFYQGEASELPTVSEAGAVIKIIEQIYLERNLDKHKDYTLKLPLTNP